MLYSRFNSLDFQYKATTFWSLHVLSQIGLQVPQEARLSLLSSLPNKIEDRNIRELPTLLLSIGSLFEFDSPVPSEVKEVVQFYSKMLHEHGGLEGISSVNLHALILSWAKIKLASQDLLKVAKQAVMADGVFQQGSENDLRGIIMAVGQLKWKDQELLEYLFQTFTLFKQKYDLVSLVSIFYSFAMVYPKMEIFECVAQEIADQLDNVEPSKKNLDIVSYTHIWLASACFEVKLKESPEMAGLARRLVRFLNVNEAWKAAHFSASEVATLVLCANMIGSNLNKYNQLLAELVRKKISEFTASELVTLAGCSIFEESKYTIDVVKVVHDRCQMIEGSLSKEQRGRLRKIYLGSDEIFPGSVFTTK